MSSSTPISEKTLTVSEVAGAIRLCLDLPQFKGMEVFGEVSGVRVSGPHAYFTIKDRDSQLQVSCFYVSKTYLPKEGESIVMRCSADLYAKSGRLSLIASSITPAGKGLLFLEFERLKARLEAEGLFDPAHKKPIPKYSKEVLVITSRSGAVIRDIITTVRRKNPVINITVKDVRVQGEGAAKDICEALRRADVLGYDVIIIARGGGSLEDLAPFYDEELARTVFAMNTPVISAVGHETDFSLCDFVADARAATPTAAAELAAYDYYALLDTVSQSAKRLTRLAENHLERKLSRARYAAAALQRHSAEMIAARKMRVGELISSMTVSLSRKADAAEYAVKGAAAKLCALSDAKIRDAEHRAAKAVGALDNLNPLKVLKRGYFKIETEGGKLGGVSALKVGDSITAFGHDGKIAATVRDITLFEEEVWKI